MRRNVIIRRRLQALGVLLLVLAIMPVQAFAHTKLLEMEPKPGSQHELSPDRVLLVFNQQLEAITDDTVVVKDGNGNLVATGPAEIGLEGKSIQLKLPDLVMDTYSVHYHVISLDGHMVKGNYAFTVLVRSDDGQTAEPANPEVVPVPDQNLNHETISSEEERNLQERWALVFTGIEAAHLLRIVYFVILLLLLGMVMWHIVLRGRSEEECRRQRNWTLQLQRIHLLILIAVIVEFVQYTVGFDDWMRVRDILLNTTAGIFWSVLLMLSLIGFGLLHRFRLMDTIWLLAFIAAKTQIGHAAASEDRWMASLMTGIHLFAAALWAGGLFYLVLLWRRYRYDAERLILTFSNGSLLAIILLAMSGLVNSALYLPDLSYVLESRWGLLLIIKVGVVLLVIVMGTFIRRWFISNGLLSVGTWIKLDLVLMIIIAGIAALLTTSEPVPPNEPMHWHVMGEEVHMTAKIAPKVPGNNRFAVSVWLPEGSGEPGRVSMHITSASNNEGKQEIELMRVDGSDEYGFAGFEAYLYQAESDELDRAGAWVVDVSVTDRKNRVSNYTKQIRVY
jgi:copper transport protein